MRTHSKKTWLLGSMLVLASAGSLIADVTCTVKKTDAATGDECTITFTCPDGHGCSAAWIRGPLGTIIGIRGV